MTSTLRRLGWPAVYDALMRLPLTLLAAFFLVREWQALETARGPLAITANVATMLFLALIAAMTVARRRPVRKAEGWLPRGAALAGVLLLYALLLLPRAEPEPWWDGASLALVLAGSALCSIALLQLGRSLSVMPEARRLVTAGLYARIRHPLYLAEAVAAFGALLQYRSAAALSLVAVQLAVQIWRMREEEKVLLAAFPDYASYRARTARLIPGIY